MSIFLTASGIVLHFTTKGAVQNSGHVRYRVLSTRGLIVVLYGKNDVNLLKMKHNSTLIVMNCISLDTKVAGNEINVLRKVNVKKSFWTRD
jgi:hypothetical protein